MIKVKERHMFTRFLYANPVCILSVVKVKQCVNHSTFPNDDGDTSKGGLITMMRRNCMTISWITPLDNHSAHFILSMKKTRFTATEFLVSNHDDSTTNAHTAATHERCGGGKFGKLRLKLRAPFSPLFTPYPCLLLLPHSLS